METAHRPHDPVVKQLTRPVIEDVVLDRGRRRVVDRVIGHCCELRLGEPVFQRVAHQRPHFVNRILPRDLAANLSVKVLRAGAG